MERDLDEESLRQRFHEEATAAVKPLAKDETVVAAILTGSAAWGTPNPDGDLDILLVTEGRPGVFYRYLLPKFCAVTRRTELGHIPVETIARHAGKAYATPLSCSLLEQIKNGRVLFQKETRGDDLIESCRQVLPDKLTIGKMIERTAAALKSAGEESDLSQFESAVIEARAATSTAARLLVLARDRVAVSKEKHEYRAVRKLVAEDGRRAYAAVMGIGTVGEEDARETIDRSIELMKWVLARRSLSPELANYDRKR